MRADNRSPGELRSVTIEPNVSLHAEGSCLITCGDTRVRCTASVESRVPPWLRNAGRGWITGEYGMLPRATSTRMRREAAAGKQGGRTQEIQRLIGRSLRMCADLTVLGERMLTVDCDVLDADGGTRTAAITGGYVALRLAADALLAKGVIGSDFLVRQVAAVSCGVHDNTALLDLDYKEDSGSDTDANFVLTRTGELVELQATAESQPYSTAQLTEMIKLATDGCQQLFELQDDAIQRARSG